MPKIGMRIIKSAIAVFICFLIYFLRGTGLPFYSAISAIICLKAGVPGSIKMGRNRTVATFVGGLYGLIALVISRMLFDSYNEMLGLTLASIMLIPLMYTMVLLKFKDAVSTSCVVFLSIVVNHMTDVSPLLYTANRVIDTLIGVFVAVIINSFRIPRKKNTDILFLAELEGGILDTNRRLTSYTKSSIEQLIQDEAKISFISKRTPGDLVNVLEGLDLRTPIITMSGASIYDWNKRTYLYSESLNRSSVEVISDILDEMDMNSFKHCIINDMLHVYYGDFKNEIESKFYHEEKLVPMKNYIYGDVPKYKEVIYFMIINTEEKIEELMNRIKDTKTYDDVKFDKYDYKGIHYLKIYNASAGKDKALNKLRRNVECNRVAIFENDENDKSLLTKAEYLYVIGDIEDSARCKIHGKIQADDHIAVIRYIRKLFYNRVKRDAV